MRRAAPLLVSLALLLAGCITSSTDPPAEDTGAVAPAAIPEGAQDAAPAPEASSSGGSASNASAPAASAPAPAANATTPEDEASSAPSEPRTVDVEGHGAVTLKVGAPCAAPEPAPCQPAHEAEPVRLALAEKDPSRAVLAITWTPTTAATESLSFNVTGPDGATLGEVAGTGPLVLSLPAEALRGLGEVVVAVVPPTPGAVVGQEFDLVLSLTYDA